MTDNRDKLLDHDYDGIREMDNDLPRWWVWVFALSIVWAVVYFLYFQVLGVGYSSEDSYREELDPGFVRGPNLAPYYYGVIPKYRSPLAVTSDDLDRLSVAHSLAMSAVMSRDTDTPSYVLLSEPADIAAGKDIFLVNCASCHGKLGEGGVGPNLTDNYWLHGSEFNDIVKTVRYGFPTKGMIAWLGTIPEDDIIRAASFVVTLKGSTSPNAKGPEGERTPQ